MDDTGRDQQRETSVEKYMMLPLVFTLGHTPMAMSGGVGEHGEEVGGGGGGKKMTKSVLF